MENQNLNQENQNQENQTNNQDPKPKIKNPKRVAAGKKGAEGKWKRMQAQQVPTDQQEAPVEQETVTRVTREPQETESTFKVNVYQNYIPLCAVLIFGIGIFMLYNKSVPATQVIQPPQQSTPKLDINPFEMN